MDATMAIDAVRQALGHIPQAQQHITALCAINQAQDKRAPDTVNNFCTIECDWESVRKGEITFHSGIVQKKHEPALNRCRVTNLGKTLVECRIHHNNGRIFLLTLRHGVVVRQQITAGTVWL